jgi:hypothetical protein
MVVKIFTTVVELQKFITSNAVTAAKVTAIYYDGASGKHVLVYTP